MKILAKASDHSRSPGDPSVIETGPSSSRTVDRSGKNLGWFSIGLGLTELFCTRALARALGMEGKETLIRAYGVRELISGVMCLSVDRQLGTWSRVAGDAIDIATLLSVYNDDNPKKSNVGIALAAVAGVTLADVATAQGLTMRHGRPRKWRNYSDRSGWPKGLSAARGAAANFRPDDMRTRPRSAAASPVTGRTSPATDAMMDEVTESTSVLGARGDGEDRSGRPGN